MFLIPFRLLNESRKSARFRRNSAFAEYDVTETALLIHPHEFFRHAEHVQLLIEDIEVAGDPVVVVTWTRTRMWTWGKNVASSFDLASSIRKSHFADLLQVVPGLGEDAERRVGSLLDEDEESALRRLPPKSIDDFESSNRRLELQQGVTTRDQIVRQIDSFGQMKPEEDSGGERVFIFALQHDEFGQIVHFRTRIDAKSFAHVSAEDAFDGPRRRSDSRAEVQVRQRVEVVAFAADDFADNFGDRRVIERRLKQEMSNFSATWVKSILDT